MTAIQLISILSPLTIVVLCWKHRFTPIWFYALAGFCCDISSYWFEPKQLIGNIFFLIEFICFSLFFSRLVYANTRWWYGVTAIVSLGYVMWLATQPPDKLQIECGSIFCMIYIGYGLFAFHNLLRNTSFKREERTYMFAQTTAIYVYASGCCLLFLFAGVVDKQFLTLLWSTFFVSINIFRYLMTAFALYRKPVYGS